jgi:hypothetical protein
VGCVVDCDDNRTSGHRRIAGEPAAFIAGTEGASLPANLSGRITAMTRPL